MAHEAVVLRHQVGKINPLLLGALKFSFDFLVSDIVK
jgi:hypothetical protein